MAVQAASLEVLEKAAVPPAQARAIVQAIEIEIAGASDRLATKHDLSTLGQELRSEMAGLRHEVTENIWALRGEFHTAMTSNVRHTYAALSAHFALLLGVAYFFVSHLQR